MTDLTKITTPFGLLDEETQRALKECGGPWERYEGDDGWRNTVEPAWISVTTYRQKLPPSEYVAWQVLTAEGERHALYPDKPTADYLATRLGGRVVKLTGRDDDRA